jgi:hypothetical protein
MISHEHRCIFIHQRKVAGAAIIGAFGLKGSDPAWHAFNDGVRTPAKSGLWSDKERDYPDYFVFTAVRNPWDRFVSAWKYCASTRARSLEDVLRNPPRRGRSPEEDHDYRHLMRPQVDILRDPSGALVSDFVIRYEALQRDFDEVCNRIGKPGVRLPMTNRTRHRHYSTYYDSRSRSMVAELFRDDIEVFDYRFEDGVGRARSSLLSRVGGLAGSARRRLAEKLRT